VIPTIFHNYPRRLYDRRRGYGVQLHLSVCPRSKKQLELSTPNFVHVYSTAVAPHALTQRSTGQRSRSHGYKNRHGRTVASDACCYGRVLLLSACVCMSIRLAMYSSYRPYLTCWTDNLSLISEVTYGQWHI